jgi:hypothetical protein
MSQIILRYNTDKDKVDASLPPWRVIIDGVERLAASVTIETGVWTSRDEIAPGVIKWHIRCEGTANWYGRDCVITPLLVGRDLPNEAELPTEAKP